MKRFIFTLAAVIAVYFLNAQTNPTAGSSGNVQAPDPVSTQFSTDYPNMNATWSMDGSNYRADYTDGGTGRSVTYDRSGNVMNHDEQLSTGNYPSGISDYYTKNYPGEQYNVWSTTDGSGNRTYYANGNADKLVFDKNGKYKSKSKLHSSGKTGNNKKPANK